MQLIVPALPVCRTGADSIGLMSLRYPTSCHQIVIFLSQSLDYLDLTGAKAAQFFTPAYFSHNHQADHKESRLTHSITCTVATCLSHPSPMTLFHMVLGKKHDFSDS